jgi:urease accessory protein
VSEFPREPWRATLALRFERRAGATALVHNAHSGPIRVQKALYPEGAARAQVLLVHPPAGIASGDLLAVSAQVDALAQVQITTPGAGKWYQSFGAQGVMRVQLCAHEGAELEWLPQENIVFSGANACMDMQIDLHKSAAFIGWDILCLGRKEGAALFTDGSVRSDWTVRLDGAVVWRERARVEGGSPLLHSAVGLRGNHVVGTLIATAPALRGDPAPALAALRELTGTEALAGCTALPWGIVVRALSSEPEALRAYFMQCWKVLRPLALHQAAVAPRIWST